MSNPASPRRRALAVHTLLARSGISALLVSAVFSGSRAAQTAGQNERLIAFTRVFAHAPHQRVFLIGDEGHGLRPLKTRIVPSGQPRWSPDGHWLVFRGGADDDLYVIRPDGSSLRNLTHDSGA